MFSSPFSSGVLPAYELPDEDPPLYNTVPQEDEQRVAYNPRPGTSERPGNYVKSWKHLVLILREQDENIACPTYARHGNVYGEIGVSRRHNECILEVSVKLYGQLSMMASDCGPSAFNILSDKKILWKFEPPDTGQGKPSQCPSILPFSIRFPLTYQAMDGKTWKLPPSFEHSYLGVPAIIVRCAYTLSVRVVKSKRYCGIASWNSSKTFTVTLNYRPRLRPQRPIVMMNTVMESLKPVPEEWQQLMMTMETRLGSNAKPIECNFLVPSVATFSITDIIPFHIQLCGTLESLRQLVPTTSCLFDPPNEENRQHLAYGEQGPYSIRVQILRQLHLEVNGRKRYRAYNIGTSKMWPVPPVMTGNGQFHSHTAGSDEICLDWQGEVRCGRNVTCGGFNAGAVLVKDFIVLSLTPWSTRSSFLVPVQLAHPIRLVTESWMDLDSMHPQDR